MNRLYLHFAVHVLIALGLSVLAANFFARYPVFTADTHNNKNELSAVGDAMQQLLGEQPTAQWDELISQNGYDEYFDISWYATNENDLADPEQSELKANKRQIIELEDGTQALEILFAEQQEILLVSRYQRATEILNLLFLVFVIITICTTIAALALTPVINRLRQMQTLAGYYRSGQWQARNTDKRKDPIGELGNSLEKMANQIQVLLSNNESLVKDQRDLMQALTHEFRAPMARMRFALEMHDDGRLDENSHKELSLALDDLTELVSEMLYYARLQTSAPVMHPDPLSLNQLIDDCCRICRKVHPAAQIEFSCDQEGINIMADATHLQRAVVNLIGNAAKYGNISNCLVQVNISSQKESVAIHVDDNGQGIPLEDRQQVFKPFVRLDASRSKKISGNGLGLAIAQRVAEKHGGNIQITDSVLGGARFTLTMPRSGNVGK